MTKETFEQEMWRADLTGGNYAEGYRRGLRRYYYGEGFGTAEDHHRWLGFGRNGDNRSELGDGYRSGFAGECFDLAQAK
jgi:hypothetical protein